jgi:hypothetical protein
MYANNNHREVAGCSGLDCRKKCCELILSSVSHKIICENVVLPLGKRTGTMKHVGGRSIVPNRMSFRTWQDHDANIANETRAEDQVLDVLHSPAVGNASYLPEHDLRLNL